MKVLVGTTLCDVRLGKYSVNTQASIHLVGAKTKENQTRCLVDAPIATATVLFPWMTFSRYETVIDDRKGLLEVLEHCGLIERTGNFLMHNQWGFYCPVVKIQHAALETLAA